jgi:hypothetical protein
VSLVAFGPQVVPRVHVLMIAAVRWIGRASRRAGFALPGRARLVQVERPAGRTTWTRRAWSGCLRCAAGSPRAEAGIPERPGPGRDALAAGGHLRVVGPEALPAENTIVRGPARMANRGRSRSPPPRIAPQVIGETPPHPRTLKTTKCHDRCRRRRERRRSPGGCRGHEAGLSADQPQRRCARIHRLNFMQVFVKRVQQSFQTWGRAMRRRVARALLS